MSRSWMASSRRRITRCHLSPVGTTPVDNRVENGVGQRQRVVMTKPAMSRPNPTARFQWPTPGIGILVRR